MEEKNKGVPCVMEWKCLNQEQCEGRDKGTKAIFRHDKYTAVNIIGDNS